jgi:ribosomal protein L11 methyltransferase
LKTDVDQALRVIVPKAFAEAAGAVLMELLGPFEEQGVGAGLSAADSAEPGGQDAAVALVFYPTTPTAPNDDEVLAALPSEVRATRLVRIERSAVSRDWVEGWKAHFRPVVIGEVRICPPWEQAPAGAAPDGAAPARAAPARAAPDGAASDGAASDGTAPESAPVDVVINPGLGFGTGLHPTTRGVLRLLQGIHPDGRRSEPLLGPLVDAGTGSGILAIAAAKLGWGPIFAFDNDPDALASARDNIEANGVGGVVDLQRVDLERASLHWFADATVLANMTLEPILVLVRKLAHNAASFAGGFRAARPHRLVVSGILAGEQEQRLLAMAALCGFVCDERLYEAEWVTIQLVPIPGGETSRTETGGW